MFPRTPSLEPTVHLPAKLYLQNGRPWLACRDLCQAWLLLGLWRAYHGGIRSSLGLAAHTASWRMDAPLPIDPEDPNDVPCLDHLRSVGAVHVEHAARRLTVRSHG